MAVAKDQIRQIIAQNDIQNVSDVYALMKESFKDILQELLEAEMDATLGYSKNQKGNLECSNKRNGIPRKRLRVSLEKFQSISLVIVKVNLNQN